jgi:hypothetical protein
LTFEKRAKGDSQRSDLPPNYTLADTDGTSVQDQSAETVAARDSDDGCDDIRRGRLSQ